MSLKEAPDSTTGKRCRVASEDVERLRGLVGKNDAHRIKIAMAADPEIVSTTDVKYDTTISMTEEQKDQIQKISKQNFATSFHRLMVSLENQEQVRLDQVENYMPQT